MRFIIDISCFLVVHMYLERKDHRLESKRVLHIYNFLFMRNDSAHQSSVLFLAWKMEKALNVKL